MYVNRVSRLNFAPTVIWLKNKRSISFSSLNISQSLQSNVEICFFSYTACHVRRYTFLGNNDESARHQFARWTFGPVHKCRKQGYGINAKTEQYPKVCTTCSDVSGRRVIGYIGHILCSTLVRSADRTRPLVAREHRKSHGFSLSDNDERMFIVSSTTRQGHEEDERDGYRSCPAMPVHENFEVM